ncbi:MAG: phosphoribosylamine--glycine ligase [Hydrocarboniphaga sp.]|uniref:Phosphoribosylamine--glycine ligase n=2 Tax=Nevskiaceae TaxID=568386 RepID=I8T6K0_9GAMM|nr:MULTISPECIES: phosphoribosylamine--glycine ligase [Hydrocarboniphaga]EIT69550.1 phosphoribosylamine/glycine ligase [Hydrocarboniphaga effusa AP103]MDZ4080136.1 phosphoribosylamine--glycine ligase [Hydrocarboniphaga sp.]
MTKAAMKVLVIGSGGREHALAWKLAQSPNVNEVVVAPGNPGTAREARCRNVNVAVEDIAGLVALARSEQVGLTVVGPEVPLSLGVVDAFEAAGLRIFGPSRDAAQLEASKAFSKDFLARHRIPTAQYQVFTDVDAALAYIDERGAPIVVKADGLAAGKGVVVATTVEEAAAAVRDMLGGSLLGKAGARVVIEDFLDGEEASFIVVAGESQYVPLETSQDHKRIFDGDQGPNTGGMGAYSPAPVVTQAVYERVCREVIEPTLAGMRAEGRPFTGFLYAGLMIDKQERVKVLEFNTRMGDPETQPIMVRLESDLLDLLQAALDRKLDQVNVRWSAEPAIGVVLAAAGYPGTVEKGDVINGLGADLGAAKVFHAGTAERDGQVVTSGGRVLCVVAKGRDIATARATAYAAVDKISWRGLQFRRDIAHRALGRI